MHFQSDFELAQLRHQELIKEAEQYHQFDARLPRRFRLTDRLLHSFATILIALGQALHSGARGSA